MRLENTFAALVHLRTKAERSLPSRESWVREIFSLGRAMPASSRELSILRSRPHFPEYVDVANLTVGTRVAGQVLECVVPDSHGNALAWANIPLSFHRPVATTFCFVSCTRTCNTCSSLCRLERSTSQGASAAALDRMRSVASLLG